jgi:hypothetical protein
MPGSVAATLEGLATSLTFAPYGEHTYVTSSCGFTWECFGQASGGNSLTSGVGDSFVADCLSYPRGTVRVAGFDHPQYAGIIYGITGVCHQASNRILFAAQLLVSKAQGYGLSRVFGPYGLGPWPERTKCLSSKTTHSSDTLANPLEDIASKMGLTRSDNPMNEYDRVALSTVDGAEDSPKELAAFLKARLLRPLPDTLVWDLFALEQGFHKHQEKLVHQLEGQQISREVYLQELNMALRFLMERSRKLLGEKDFTLVYGEAGAHPESLVNPETFLASH